MVLQPLVENAVKYAIEPKKEAGVITLSSTIEQDTLRLCVSDEGSESQFDLEPGLGIGLKNTRERLNMMFNGKGDVAMSTNAKGGTTVVLTMPVVLAGERRG